MKVLVTGATGFVGSHLVDHLLEHKHDVRCIVRRSSNRKWLVDKPIELIECERIDDAAAVRAAVQNAEIVFHVLGTLVAPNLDAFRKVNVEPVRQFLDACIEERALKRFVLVGSQGAAGPTRTPDGKLTETDPCEPVSAYGRSKLEAEEVTRRYQGKVPWTIVRLSAVYGPRDVNFLTIFRSAQRRGAVPQVGREPKSNSLAYVSDIVDGIYRAATTDKSLNETYFLASEQPCSMHDLAASLQAAMNKPVAVRVIPNFVVKGMMLYADLQSKVFKRDILLNRDRLATLSYPRWVCDVSKACADLGYRQAVPLEIGVRQAYEWYCKEGLL